MWQGDMIRQEVVSFLWWHQTILGNWLHWQNNVWITYFSWQWKSQKCWNQTTATNVNYQNKETVWHATFLVNSRTGFIGRWEFQQTRCVPSTWKPYMLQWPLPDVTSGVGNPQMNSFEQVSSVSHQMLVAQGVPGLMSRVGAVQWGLRHHG